MKINVDLVRELRKAQAWSQDELAIAAGLNLRTIQRIESDGSASLQSKKALASAFGINVRDLDQQEGSGMVKHEYKVVIFEVKWRGMGGTKVDPDFPEMETELNELGDRGWVLFELTNIHGDMGYTKAVMATFRRPVD